MTEINFFNELPGYEAYILMMIGPTDMPNVRPFILTYIHTNTNDVV